MQKPLVSVICLCYNQGRFIREAVASVLAQTYQPIQIIIVDDASTDDSVAIIQDLKKENPQLALLLLNKNKGNCAAFNQGLKLVKGEFVIDLAADDILLPNRVAIGVARLTALGDSYGVHYGDAILIAEDGKEIQKHSQRIQYLPMPSGDIYEPLIEHYFICSPTMLIRKVVLDQLKGYDESLQYEDFDFWIRSSRNFLYDCTTEVLVKKRMVKGSLSDIQFNSKVGHWKSTLKVLEKVEQLNRSESERLALKKRLRYEILHHIKRFSLIATWHFVRVYFRM